MIFLKDQLEYKVFKFTIHYYKIESITDFSFLTILLANKAIEEGKDLSTLLKDFTKGNNDYFLLLSKKFESLFKINIEKFLNAKEAIINSREQKKQFKKETEDKNIKYNKDINKFLYEDMFWDKGELVEYISTKYNNETMQFKNIDISEITNSEIILVEEDFNLFNDLSYFEIRNIKKSRNEEIMNKLIKNIKEKSYSLLPKNIDNILIKIDNYDDKLLQINREYKKSNSHFIEILNFEDSRINEKINFKLELNLKEKNEEIIISKIFLYENVPFIKEFRFTFLEFKKQEYYKELIDLLFNNIKDINNKFQKIFLKYSDTKYEFKLIDKYIDFKINSNYSIEKTDLMIKNNINFINDINFVENDMYNLMIKSKFINYYKFIANFYPNLTNKMIEKKKVSLLSEIYISNSKLLTKEDREWISNFINDKGKLYDQIKGKINSFTSERGWNDELLNLINEYSKNDKNKFIDSEFLKGQKFWRHTINFFAHFSQETRKKEHKNQKEVFKIYKDLEDLKKRYLNLEKNNYNTYNVSLEDLNYLDKIWEDLNKFKDEANKKFKDKQY